MESGQQVNLLIAFGAGLISFITPCVLPMVPSYIAFIAGMSLSELTEEAKAGGVWKRTLVNALGFVVGFSLVFILVMGGVASVFQQVLSGQGIFLRVAGGLLILMGLVIAGLVKIPWLQMEKRFEVHKKPANVLGAGVVGMAFAAGWTPCVGPILGAILFYTAASKTSGILMLTAYSVGLAIPFLVTALALNQFLATYSRFRRHLTKITFATGMLLVVIGVLMVAGLWSGISQSLTGAMTALWARLGLPTG